MDNLGQELPSQQLPSDRNRRWLKWVLIVALLSSATTFFVLQSRQPVTPTISPGELTPPPLPPEALLKGTEDWKTYTNTKYHFSFKYPKEWQIGGAPNATVSDLSQSDIINLTSPCNYQAGDYCSQVDFKVGIYDPTFSDPSSGSKLLSKRVVEIDGVSSMERIYLSSYDNGAGKEPTRLNYSLVLVTGKSPQKNMIFINYIEQNKNVVMQTPDQWKNKKTFDQILSTFKFIQ